MGPSRHRHLHKGIDHHVKWHGCQKKGLLSTDLALARPISKQEPEEVASSLGLQFFGLPGCIACGRQEGVSKQPLCGAGGRVALQQHRAGKKKGPLETPYFQHMNADGPKQTQSSTQGH